MGCLKELQDSGLANAQAEGKLRNRGADPACEKGIDREIQLPTVEMHVGKQKENYIDTSISNRVLPKGAQHTDLNEEGMRDLVGEAVVERAWDTNYSINFESLVKVGGLIVLAEGVFITIRELE